MTGAAFRTLALSLPDTEEGSHMGHADFRVAGKIFATLPDADERRGMVKLKPEDQQTLVRERPEAFAPARGAWGRAGSTCVDLRAVDRPTLRAALVAAWKNVAPRRMVEAFGPDDRE
jgi:hypothetical protein